MKPISLTSIFLITPVLVVLLGCNSEDPDSEWCPNATVDLCSVPADTICFGNWQWVYTIKWRWLSFQQEWIIEDTIYPGDEESGYEVLHDVWCSIDEKEIAFVRDDYFASGCYQHWQSYKPTDTVISLVCTQWVSELSPDGGLIVDAYLPVELDDPVYAQISGSHGMYYSDEELTGIRYRNRFVKFAN